MPRRHDSGRMKRVGVLGGTGISRTDVPTLTGAELLTVSTPYGDVEVLHANDAGIEWFFIHRHGPAHAPPHRVRHRANIDALARCGVDAIFALNAVGALDASIPPGSLLIPDDYIDFRSTHETFHEDAAVHVDVGRAYCPHLRALLLAASHAARMPARDGGVYAATDGPRLETRAEVRALRGLGGDVVGMTGCPEAALARERALCYASLCLVTNPAAGVGGGELSAHELKAAASKLAPISLSIIAAAGRGISPERECACRRALDDARL